VVLAAAGALAVHCAAGGVDAARVALVLGRVRLVADRALDVHVAGPAEALHIDWGVSRIDPSESAVARAAQADVGQLGFACEVSEVSHGSLLFGSLSIQIPG
jgi:hypothetical protein